MSTIKRLRWRDRLLIFALAFLMRGLTLIWFATTGLDPLRWSLDSWEYTAMLSEIQKGNWGFQMFILRPPGYPLVFQAFATIFRLSPPQILAWLPFQVALTSIGAVFAVHVIFRLTHDRRIALVGGLVLAFDPIFIGAEAPILSEALFNPMVITAVLFLLRWLHSRRSLDFIVCLLALQMAVLARATGEYYIVIVCAVIVLYNRSLWRYALLLLIGFAAPVVLWTARNVYFTGINTYSSSGVYNLLFYKDISTESMVTGKSPSDLAWSYATQIEARLGDAVDRTMTPTGNYIYLYVNNAERYKIMSEMAWSKAIQFNLWNVVKMPYHIFELFHNNETLSLLIPPVVQFPLTVVTLLLLALGILRWLKKRRPLWMHVLVLGTFAYFLFGTIFFLGLPSTRLASDLNVYYALLVALGLTWIYDRLRPPTADSLYPKTPF